MKSLILFLTVLTLSTAAFSQETEKKHHGHGHGHDHDKKCFWVPTMNGNPVWGQATPMDLDQCKQKLMLVKFKRPHGAVCECKDEHGHGHGH